MRKFMVVFTALFFILCAGYGHSYAFDKGDQDCSKCHTLSTDQAKETLDALIPGVKILHVQNTQLKGFWEIGMESGGKKGIIYLDFSKKKLFLGSLIDLKTRVNHTQESFAKINTVDLTLLTYENALVMGDKDAKIKVAVFDDPDWPYCGKLHQEMKKVIEKRKDIAFYIFLYPLPMHTDAPRKAKAIVCEKSLALLDDAFAKKPIPDPKCDTKVVDENIKLAEKLGINGTPALIFPDGMLVSGALDADKIISMIDKK